MAVKIIQAFENFSLPDFVSIFFLFILLAALFAYLKKIKSSLMLYSYILIDILVLVLTLTGVIADKVVYIFAVIIPLFVVFELISSDLRRDIIRWSYQAKEKQFKIALSSEQAEETINAIVRACTKMSKSDIGALIIIANNEINSAITESGTNVGAHVTSELVETIFWHKSPLHDGAVLIKGDTIIAAGCYLPLTQSTSISKELGTRHRAAIGVTELNPTLTAIVVSEETGIISVVVDGDIKMYLDANSLKKHLLAAYKLITIESTENSDDDN